MKKYLSIVFLALVAMLSLTSCDDEAIARNLSDGIWEGEVESEEFWTNRWGDEFVTTTNQYVDMEFNADPDRYAKGMGVEWDYYTRGGREYRESVSFRFEVSNRKIYLDYADGAHVVIRNYSLHGDFFEGEFEDYHTGRLLARFRFSRYNNWRHDRYSYYQYAPRELKDSIK